MFVKRIFEGRNEIRAAGFDVAEMSASVLSCHRPDWTRRLLFKCTPRQPPPPLSFLHSVMVTVHKLRSRLGLGARETCPSTYILLSVPARSLMCQVAEQVASVVLYNVRTGTKTPKAYCTLQLHSLARLNFARLL